MSAEDLPTWAALGLLSVAREELDDAKSITNGSTCRAQPELHKPPLSGVNNASAVVAAEIRAALAHVLNAHIILSEALRLVEANNSSLPD